MRSPLPILPGEDNHAPEEPHWLWGVLIFGFVFLFWSIGSFILFLLEHHS